MRLLSYNHSDLTRTLTPCNPFSTSLRHQYTGSISFHVSHVVSTASRSSIRCLMPYRCEARRAWAAADRVSLTSQIEFERFGSPLLFQKNSSSIPKPHPHFAILASLCSMEYLHSSSQRQNPSFRTSPWIRSCQISF